ncbi:MAG: hypothetical protein ACR2N8_01080 [Parvibaculales bacterium]
MSYFSRTNKSMSMMKWSDFALIEMGFACVGVLLACLFPALLDHSWQTYLIAAVVLGILPCFAVFSRMSGFKGSGFFGSLTKACQTMKWYHGALVELYSISLGLMLAVLIDSWTEAGWLLWLVVAIAFLFVPLRKYFRNL